MLAAQQILSNDRTCAQIAVGAQSSATSDAISGPVGGSPVRTGSAIRSYLRSWRPSGFGAGAIRSCFTG